MIQVTNLKYLLLNVWDEVEEAGGNEDSAWEAGAETDESLPASPGGEVGVVSELWEQFEGQHSTEESDDHHGEQGHHLLGVELLSQDSVHHVLLLLLSVCYVLVRHFYCDLSIVRQQQLKQLKCVLVSNHTVNSYHFRQISENKI